MTIAFLTKQKCDLYPATIGANGLPKYSDSPTYEDVSCRKESSRKQYQTAKETSITSDAVIYFLPSAMLARNTKIVIGSQEFIIDQIDTCDDIAGNIDHYECLCREITE